MRGITAWVIVLWTALVPATAASAGGVRDLADAWLVDGRELARWLRSEPGEESDAWWLETTQGRLWGLPELPQVGVRLAHDPSPWLVTLGWERLGADLYAERTLRGQVMRDCGWLVGVGVEHRGLALGGSAIASHLTLQLNVGTPSLGPFRCDLSWPLTAAPPWFGTRGPRRWLRLLYAPADGLLAVRLDRRPDGSPTVQVEVVLPLAPRMACSGRLDTASATLGFGTAWRVNRLLLRTGHLVHPDLGVSHRVGLGVRL